MMRRKDVLIEFSATELAEEKGCNWDYPDTDAMADEIVQLRYEIVRLRRTLAALREPSEAFIDTVVRFGYSHFHGMPIQPANFLRAAIAAAEKEVANDAG